MKRFNFVMVSLAIFATLICVSALRARADDQQAVSDMERKLAAVTNANEAMKYFESGNDIVLFDVMGPPREFVGHKAIHDHLMGFNAWKDVKVDFIGLKVITGCIPTVDEVSNSLSLQPGEWVRSKTKRPVG